MFCLSSTSEPTLPCTEIDGAGEGTLADYQELALGLLDENTPRMECLEVGRSRLSTGLAFRTGFGLLEAQPHFVGVRKSERFVEIVPFGTGVEIDAVQATRPGPGEDHLHDLVRHAAAAELGLGVDVQNDGALGAGVMGIGGPGREQDSAATGHPPSAIDREPMPVRTVS